MADFMTDPTAISKMIQDQTKMLLAIRDQHNQQMSGYAQNIGGGLGEGVAGGMLQAQQDKKLRDSLQLMEKAGHLAPGWTADSAFQAMKGGAMGNAPLQTPTTPVQSSEMYKNMAQGDLAKQEIEDKKNPKPPKLPEGMEPLPDSVARSIGVPPGTTHADAVLLQHGTDETMKSLVELNRSMNPTDALRGSLLGVVGQNNSRAMRALSNLKDPTMVTQQLNLVTADVAGIMANGSPSDRGAAESKFSNILTRWADLRSKITSNPAAINNPDVVAKVRSIVRDIKKVDNDIIKDNVKEEMDKVGPMMKKYPEFKEAALKMKEDVLKSNLVSEDTGKPASEMNNDELLKALNGQ